MPVPKHIFDPPFNIVRCSHVVLAVTDLEASLAFYAGGIGLHLESREAGIAYLRGYEERNRHSLVLRQANEAACLRMGYKVASEDDLDKAAAWFKAEGLPATFVEVPHQGRTLHANDAFGVPLELCYRFDSGEKLLQKYALYKGCHAQRFDHFNLYASDLQGMIDWYARLGFRLTEYSETDDPANPQIGAAWMHRKGTVHDTAFTNGRGPRLHHFAYFVPSAINIVHLCDVLASSGYLANMERGPGRHGISNAFFLYVRDPDGHRIELYASDYLTVDPDHAPIRWSMQDPRRQTLWGQPAPRSWFEEGSVFPGVTPRDALFDAKPIMAG